MSNLLDKPERWRERATEARILAKTMKDDEARRSMEEIARSYERLAERAAGRAKKSS